MTREEESLILEIVWNDNLWRGACRDPLGNSNCTGEAFDIWYPDKGDVEKINAQKPSACGDPSAPGRCAESAIFSEWEYLRWPKTAPALHRKPRYLFFVSEQPGGSHAQGHFLRGFYTVTGIEERDERTRAVLGDPGASSWFHPGIEIKLEDYTEPVKFMAAKGKYISHNVADNLAERWLKEELQQHRILLEEHAGDEEACKEIEMIISKIERALMASNNEPPEEPLAGLLRKYFISQGLHFTPEQLATFYTALKTKGFVILTGISGTGKTKLAQYFAELLGSKDQFRFAAVRPDWRDSKSLLGYFNPLLGKEGRFQSTEFLQFLLQACDNYRSSLHKLKWEAEHPNATTFLAEPDAFNTDTVRLGLKAVNASDQVVAEGIFEFKVNEKRQLALPRRIDELQPFRNAAKIYALELDRVSSYFVLLDEMNLAKVEYYFADFLSVLESGRDDDGFTKEAIRFQYPAGIDGPPRELYLPPNLYFIGTVNVDETTYMFSPKVLDRAFTLELSTVEFPEYINSTTQGKFELPPDEQQHLLDDFTRGGKFATIGKSEKEQIKAFAKQPDGKYKTYAEHLTTLNALLQPHDLHFGYRVFDEIMMFLANAEGSPVFDGFNSSPDAAFDAAVLMKVLPKFHGTRGKLRLPLLNVFAWARTPDAGHELRKQAEELEREISGSEEKEKARLNLIEMLRENPGEARIGGETFAYPRTALKALRMLHDLYTTGFASFA